MKKFAPIFIVLAACLWGTMGLFVRKLNGYGLAAMEIVEIRSVFATLILFTYTAMFKREQLKVKKKNILPLACSGVFSIVFFNFCYFKTIAMTDLSVAAILLYTSPIFVMLLSLIIFREKLSLKKVLALVLAFSGCVLVSGIIGAQVKLSLFGLLLGLGSGLGYALYSIFSRISLNQGLNSMSITNYTFLFATLGGAIFTDFSKIFSAISAYGVELVSFLIIYTLVTTVLPYLFYTTGLSYVENGPASVMASVEPVIATILGAVIYGELPSVVALCGIALVISALVLLSVGVKRENS